jgi:Vibrio phage DNA polymerase
MRIGILDMETDPFLHGRVPMPFACGFFDGSNYHETWGDDCVKEMLRYLRAYKKPLVIFAHNGGRFDFWYLAHEIGEPLLFIDSRLVQAKLFHHEIRDSFKILPVPLAEWAKEEIDYKLMERHCREKHRAVISKYLKSDCTNLYDAVARFIMTFGDVLTVGSAAMRELRKDYKIEHIGAAADVTYRPYFHGGRTEVFEVGEIKGDFKLYDVNSMYPDVMARYQHPIGTADFVCSEIPDAPFYLAHICAKSKGAFPLRTKDGLIFPHGHHEFFVTSHELQMAQRLNLCEITQVIEVHAWENTRTFEKFVHRFAAEKIRCEEEGDMGGRLLNKLIPNNGYGKFATNPERFKNYKLFDSVSECFAAGYECMGEIGPRVVGGVPATIRNRSYYNVATGASITGAARAVELHALASARRPVYCDTDSVWCTDLPLPLDQKRLGAWKLETTADTLFIAGKKLYAAQKAGEFYYTNKKGQRVPIKTASKGVRMSPEQIARVARGEVLKIPIEAPSLRIGHKAKFIARDIARTAKIA